MRIENLILAMRWGDNRVDGPYKNKAAKAQHRRHVKVMAKRLRTSIERLDTRAENRG